MAAGRENENALLLKFSKREIQLSAIELFFVIAVVVVVVDCGRVRDDGNSGFNNFNKSNVMLAY